MTEQPFLVAEDTTIPFDFFKHHGYYVVGKKIFYYKIRALQEASRTGEAIRWIFNDDTFSAVDWKQSWGISLNDVYHRRAKQLREKYDYLVLFFSGGADSTVILQSFVNNGIHLDEVVVSWPITQTQGRYTPNNQDFSPRNLLSEWEYAVKPKLDWLAQNHPEIRITVSDVLSDPGVDLYSEHTITMVNNHSFIGVNRNLELDRILRDRTEKSKSCAGIFGVSPLDCAIAEDQYLFAYFIDGATNGSMKNDYHPFTQYQRTIEFFYWTPDMPEIVREQGHAMLNYLNVNPAGRKYLPHTKLIDHKHKFVHAPDSEVRRAFKKPILYPSWQECFQVAKPEDQIGFSAWQSWWHENPHSQEYIKSWESAISSEIATVDVKFLRLRNDVNDQTELLNESLIHGSSKQAVVHHKVMLSKFYPIGRLNPVDHK